jgi:DNA-binding response OmpR family regulator
MNIAVLGGNAQALAPIRAALIGQGVEVSVHPTVKHLSASLEDQAFGAVVLEGRPDELELALTMLRLRAEARTAIIVVGGSGAAAITHALTHGADDYVFSDDDADRAVQRIIARIAIRTRQHRRVNLRMGDFELDVRARHIESQGTRLRLTARETLLARLLFESPGRVVPIDRLCIEVCGTSDAAAVRSINQHVYELRRKLDQMPAGSDRLRIEALYGAGYRIVR